MVSMNQQKPPAQKTAVGKAAQPMFSATNKLLSGLGKEQKHEPARTQSLSQKSNVVYLASAEEGMTMLQAIEEANKNGLILVPSKDIDERLNGKEQLWQAEKDFYPCWTGTLIIYAAPNKEFGKEISFEGLRVRIPRKWQRKRNCAIACNHPNFTIGKDGTIKLQKAALIENFPTQGGWHVPEKNFGIPCGALYSEEDAAARLLRLFITGPFVSLVVCGDFFLSIGGRRDFDAARRPSRSLGALAYAPQPQAEEIQK